MFKLKNILKRRKDILIFFIGLALVCYPIISNYFENITQEKMIKTYDNQVNNLSSDNINDMLDEAKKWNENLYQKQHGILSSDNSNNYNDILNINDGIMGSIEIPSIDLNIAIYHGTSDEVLSTGAGHFNDTSLPIGGENTHAVLTSHRGLPSAKLFTRLDELKLNDKFYIKILNDTLAYQIEAINVIEPSVLEEQGFPIEEGKDIITLITCTPYGINTHRLVITAHRIPLNLKEKKLIQQNIPSFREIAFYSIPVIFSVIGIFIFKKKRKEH
ncbi:class C sortase [Erysipelatoclostridium sp. An15]|uniref:class C sortase n=1 Tax=Erysipelatoclostridium sp. An15 TaxID=1965566 RepID=UPI000B38BD6D|nr:class C sortase [Erysipelatoclostridium sp. An15]OUQ02265.1 class C sortase [Erysipelatoclostridium sp. An15]